MQFSPRLGSSRARQKYLRKTLHWPSDSLIKAKTSRAQKETTLGWFCISSPETESIIASVNSVTRRKFDARRRRRSAACLWISDEESEREATIASVDKLWWATNIKFISIFSWQIRRSLINFNQNKFYWPNSDIPRVVSSSHKHVPMPSKRKQYLIVNYWFTSTDVVGEAPTYAEARRGDVKANNRKKASGETRKKKMIKRRRRCTHAWN